MSERPHFHFLTLFPDTIRVWLDTSILKRAQDAGLFSYDCYQLRDFTDDRHRTVDDVAYGGGGGMVLKMEPLVRAMEFLQEKIGEEKVCRIYFSPAGEPLSQRLLESFPTRFDVKHFILICGHYEGIDQRFVDHWIDLEVSLGDFVLTGGELPAVAFADAYIRQLDGVLGNDGAHRVESFSIKSHEDVRLLEYPHYTRPADFRGMKVPDVLLSGDHEKINHWRLDEARKRTLAKRPDLLP